MMDKGQLLLNVIGQDFSLIQKGRYYTTEEHDSLIIDPFDGVFYWNSVGLAGDVYSYLMRVKDMTFPQAKNYIGGVLGKEYTAYELYSGNDDLREPNPALVKVFYEFGKGHQQYWTDKRGYTKETIDKHKLGFTGRFWVIPVFVEGKFKNFQCRGFDIFGKKIIKSYYRGQGHLPYNLDSLPEDHSETIYITEGIVDAIALQQAGLYAVSSTGGAFAWGQDWSLLLLDYDNILIMYDNDEAGLQGAIRTSKYLQHNSKILKWPDIYPEKYDLTDFLKDNGKMEDLKDYLVPSYVLGAEKCTY